jgi:hypothetical protein
MRHQYRALRALARRRVYEPLRSSADLLIARSAAPAGAPPVRILIATDEKSFTTQQQFAPLFRHRAEVRRRLAVVLRRTTIDDVLRGSHALGNYDLLIVQFSFTTPETVAMDTIRRLSEMRGSTPLVYFDGDDDICIQWGGLLEHVDLYVKKAVFSDPRMYLRQFVGKTNLTDYVSRVHGTSFERNDIPRSGIVASPHLSKIYLGYCLGLGDMIAGLSQRIPDFPMGVRDIDVICRSVCPPDKWIYPFRGPLADRLSPLQGRFQVLLPGQRVPQSQYYAEMLRSRICVSPFGYGEICWRDYEAVLCGCLLVKPDMSHLRTEPDLFVPGDTYVPVQWDFCDLAETVARYLEDEAERRRIARRAYDVLTAYFQNHGFIGNVRAMLERVGILRRVSAVRDQTCRLG